MAIEIKTAMVLAAGLGNRMRAHDDRVPKPLVTVKGKALLDYTLDRLERAGISRAVINVHHMAEMIEKHVAERDVPEVIISPEYEEPLETGGGLIKASSHFNGHEIFCTNTDAILIDEDAEAWKTLSNMWNGEKMDALLLLCPLQNASGYTGSGDFVLDGQDRINYPEQGSRDKKYIFTGLQIIHPRLFSDEPLRKVSTRKFWDKALAQGRLFGAVYSGTWMHVGDPEGVEAAEHILNSHEV